MHVRHELFLAIFAPILLSGPIARAIEQNRVVDWRRVARIATLMVAVVGGSFGAIRLAIPFERPDGMQFPVSALNAVPQAIRSKHVFNDDFGNYLIFAGVHPMIDDRAELYGGEGLNLFQYWYLNYPWTITTLFDQLSIDWTFLSPNDSLDNLLDNDTQWVLIYRDKWASVHVRRRVWEACKNGPTAECKASSDPRHSQLPSVGRASPQERLDAAKGAAAAGPALPPGKS
jgi:hypothetical protein